MQVEYSTTMPKLAYNQLQLTLRPPTQIKAREKQPIYFYFLHLSRILLFTHFGFFPNLDNQIIIIRNSNLQEYSECLTLLMFGFEWGKGSHRPSLSTDSTNTSLQGIDLKDSPHDPHCFVHNTYCPFFLTWSTVQERLTLRETHSIFTLGCGTWSE